MIPAPLTGLAIGDALGMPFETAKQHEIRLVAWAGGYGISEYHKLGPGQWTDDTQMSMALAESLVNHQGYLPEAAAMAYREWYKNGPRGIGSNTRKAMKNLVEGVPWHESGIQHAEGNGTAMRASPIGLFYRESPSHAGNHAWVDAGITHRTIEAREGSRAVALAVAHLALGVPRTTLIAAVLPDIQPSKVRDALLDLKRPRAEVSPHVVETINAAFYAFLVTDHFRAAVEMAVRFGGDTDSVASITGALAGTHYGYEGIPKHYLTQLERAEELHALELRLQEP